MTESVFLITEIFFIVCEKLNIVCGLIAKIVHFQVMLQNLHNAG